MTILLTGITGNLYPWMDAFLKSFYHEGMEYYVMIHQTKRNFSVPINIIQQNLLEEVSCNIPFDVIIHAAAILPFHNNFLKTTKDTSSYTSITSNLLKSLKHPPKKIIFFSTDAIHHPQYYEPVYNYAISKLEQEQIIIEYCSKHNTQYVILRFPPFIENKQDFNYDIEKLKKRIAIFPFSLDKKISFLSDKNIFCNILNEALHNQLNNQIIRFEFSEPFTYKDKLNWLKQEFNLKSIVLSLPVKHPKIIKDNNEYMIKVYKLDKQENLK